MTMSLPVELDPPYLDGRSKDEERDYLLSVLWRTRAVFYLPGKAWSHLEAVAIERRWAVGSSDVVLLYGPESALCYRVVRRRPDRGEADSLAPDEVVWLYAVDTDSNWALRYILDQPEPRELEEPTNLFPENARFTLGRSARIYFGDPQVAPPPIRWMPRLPAKMMIDIEEYYANRGQEQRGSSETIRQE
ncbi:hypothetical protein [Actinokineospora enzanensis]|uniref:hypothetical protein n=1 Tax=Actinokineospora enzanensis TaxID=155975 RepID=UPI0003729658|nr:hypothetical protein [Actinokineospora enzanensis]